MLQKGSGLVLGWPEGGYPAPQGPFYCGVGTNSVFGRPLAEAHMEACLEAGLTISGINAEVRAANAQVPGSNPAHCTLLRWVPLQRAVLCLRGRMHNTTGTHCSHKRLAILHPPSDQLSTHMHCPACPPPSHTLQTGDARPVGVPDWPSGPPGAG
jgi:hypothetical protein